MIKDPAGNQWLLGRDSVGNVTSYTTPQHSSDPYALAYDSRSRLITIDDPEARRRGFDYGASGTLTKVSLDPAGGGLALTMLLTRDKFENVVKVKDSENNETLIDRCGVQRNPFRFGEAKHVRG